MSAAGDPFRQFDDLLRPLYEHAASSLPSGTEWFDVHTHIGSNDPDGMTGTIEQLIASLDAGGHRRALVFPMHEPEGYRAANDEVLAAAAASGGRLLALARVDPKAPGAVAEVRRALDAGAVGIKLHPRSDAFGLPHPVVDELAAIAGEARAPLLFHAGRGIPNLGEAAAALAGENPGARVILAHAGISDLGTIGAAAAELENLFFDTAWWQVSDMLMLFATIPPGRILYASDAPYGRSVLSGLIFLRSALAVGLPGDALAVIAGRQAERVVAGEGPIDLGPAPGPPRGPRRLSDERAVSYLAAATMLGFQGGDPTEAMSLARLACQTADGDPVLATVDALVERAEASLASPRGRGPWPGLIALVAAQLVAGTPQVDV